VTDWNVQDAGRHSSRQSKEPGLGKGSTIIQGQAQICENYVICMVFVLYTVDGGQYGFRLRNTPYNYHTYRAGTWASRCGAAHKTPFWFAGHGGVSAKRVHPPLPTCPLTPTRPHSHTGRAKTPSFSLARGKFKGWMSSFFSTLHLQILDCFP